MIFSFSGCSGSGKTTLINNLIDDDFLKRLRLIVKKEDSFLFLKIFKVFFSTQVASNFVEKNKKRKSKNDLVVFFYALFIYIEFLIEYIFYEKLFTEKIVIRDRYVIDYLITIECNLQLKNYFIKRIYKSFPSNSLSFYVNSEKKTILERNKYDKSEGWTKNPSNFIISVLQKYIQYAKYSCIQIDNPKEALDMIKSKIFFKNIKTISVSGMDGTGKSTFCKNLSFFLKKINVNSKIVHFYHDNMLFKLMKVAGLIKKPSLDKKYYRKTLLTARKTKKEGRNFIWAFLHFTDSYLQYLYYLLIDRNKLLIFDRYFYDYLVSFEYLGVKGRNFFNFLIPSPDLSLVFRINPKTAMFRKPENDLNFFVSADNLYKKIAKKYNLLVINANSKNPNSLLSFVLNNLKNE